MSRYNPSFIINSKTRLSGGISRFTHLVDISDNHNFDLVAMIACNIPKTYYNVQPGKNIFILKENGLDATITLPIGNYNEKNLPIVLKGLLDTASNSLGNSFTYNVTLPNRDTEVDTRKWIFTCSNTIVPVSFEILSEEDIDEILGFDKGIYQFTNGSLTSINVINFNLSHYFTVRTDLCSNQGNSRIDHNILQSIGIPRGLDFGETVNYTISDLKSQSKLLNNKGNKVYTFELVNDRGEVIDLNGHDWSLEVSLYKYDDVNELVKKDLIAKHLVKLDDKKVKNEDKNKSNIVLKEEAK